MTLDFFMKSFDFNDLDVLNIELKNHNLTIEVAMESHLELIANGYRPELDVIMKKAFVFDEVQVKELFFCKPYSIEIIEYNNENLVLNICKQIVIIKGKNVKIIPL